jgi:hypothetical protein
MLLGVATWIAVVITASTKLYAVGAGPLIVSGVALAACLLPMVRLPRRFRPASSPGR